MSAFIMKTIKLLYILLAYLVSNVFALLEIYSGPICKANTTYETIEHRE